MKMIVLPLVTVLGQWWMNGYVYDIKLIFPVKIAVWFFTIRAD